MSDSKSCKSVFSNYNMAAIIPKVVIVAPPSEQDTQESSTSPLQALASRGNESSASTSRRSGDAETVAVSGDTSWRMKWFQQSLRKMKPHWMKKDKTRDKRSCSEELDVDMLNRIDVEPRILRTGSYDNLTSMVWASKRLTSTHSVRRKFKRILIAFKQLTQSSRDSHHSEELLARKATCNDGHLSAADEAVVNFSQVTHTTVDNEDDGSSTALADSGSSSREVSSSINQSHQDSENLLFPVIKRLSVSLNDLSKYKSSEESTSSLENGAKVSCNSVKPRREPENGGLLRRTLSLARATWKHRRKREKSEKKLTLSSRRNRSSEHREMGQNLATLHAGSTGRAGKSDGFEEEIHDLKRQLFEKDQQLLKLHREIHKLKCVLKQCQDLDTTERVITLPASLPAPVKKCGVSGDSFIEFDVNSFRPIKKDSRNSQLIRSALLENTFLQNSLDVRQLKLIIDAMYEKEYDRNGVLCEQGASGSNLFVTAHGYFQVIVDGEPVGTIGPGKVIGELAVLYNCTRTATVKAMSKAHVWVLDRKIFQAIMVNTTLDRRHEYRSFLQSVPLLQTLDEDSIAKIVDAIEVEIFPAGEYICRQGSHGNCFFIISNGSVKVTQVVESAAGEVEEKSVRRLQKGDYFGEKALLSGGSLRTANVISEDCECLVLDRSNFFSLVGDLSELRDKRYNNHCDLQASLQSESDESIEENSHLANVTLNDLELITTLGIGGFGRVDLVRVSSDPDLVFALKSYSKAFINSTQQQQHVNNERIVQKLASKHQFVVKLYRTFKDDDHVYFLMEAAIGGELWTLLKKTGPFDENAARFYVACVVEALQYLHSQQIVYRDLKPENCLLDRHGYLKLTDFGFSKILVPGQRTWTFCGTPEYVAPEIVLNRGHDKAVDFWSIGILLYELMTGLPPFQSIDPVKTYNIILRGFDEIGFDEKVFSKNAINLIRRLCKENPSERIGVQRNGFHDLKRHKWFAGFNWAALVKRALKPPIVPILYGPTDTRYFDSTSTEISLQNHFDRDFYPSEESPSSDQVSDDWCKDF